MSIYKHPRRDLYAEEKGVIPIQYEWESYELVDSPDFLDTSFMTSLELEYPLELTSSLDSEVLFGSTVSSQTHHIFAK